MAGGYSVTISAVDKATATIDAVNKRFAAMQAPVTRLNASLGRLGESTGLSAVARGAADATRAVGNLAAGVIGLGGTATLAGVVTMANTVGQLNQRLGFSAIQIGVSAEQLSRWQGAARLAGVSSDAFTASMGSLQTTIYDAVGGRNAGALAYFRQLGVNIQNVDGSARGAAQVMPDLADKLRGLSAQAQERVLATLGISPELLPLLRNGAAGIKRLADEAGGLNTVTEGAVSRSNDLAKSQAELSLAADGLRQTLTDKLAPSLTQIQHNTATIISTNRDWIAQGISEEVDRWAARMGLLNSETAKNVDTSLQWKDVLEGASAVLLLRMVPGVGSLVGALGRLALIRLPAWLLAMGGVSATALTAGAVATGAGAVDIYRRGLTGNIPVEGPSGGERVGEQPTLREMAGAWIRARMGAAPGGAASAPRGIRNNNPLNLSYMPGQGAIGSDGRFGQYATMEEGIAASHRQLLRYQDQGTDTIRGIVSRWAPASDGNNTGGYILGVSSATGYGPDQKLDLRDPVVAGRVIAAMARREVPGGVPQSVIDAGVARSLAPSVPGPYSPGAPAAAPLPVTVNGGVTADIRLSGAPPGTTMGVTGSGMVQPTGRIETAMPMGAYP